MPFNENQLFLWQLNTWKKIRSKLLKIYCVESGSDSRREERCVWRRREVNRFLVRLPFKRDLFWFTNHPLRVQLQVSEGQQLLINTRRESWKCTVWFVCQFLWFPVWTYNDAINSVIRCDSEQLPLQRLESTCRLREDN